MPTLEVLAGSVSCLRMQMAHLQTASLHGYPQVSLWVLTSCLFTFIFNSRIHHWFTILCWFLPCINMSQPQVYKCPLPLELPSHLLAHPPPPVVTEHRFELLCHTAVPDLPVLHPTLCAFQHHSLYSPPTASASLYICISIVVCKSVHRLYFPRLHMYVLIYDTWFFLSDLPQSV